MDDDLKEFYSKSEANKFGVANMILSKGNKYKSYSLGNALFPKLF